MRHSLAISLLMLVAVRSSYAQASASSALPLPPTPAPVEEVRGEKIHLSDSKVSKWSGGTRLAHAQGMGVGKGLPVPHALDPASIVVHAGDRVLKRGSDYVVNGIYSTLSLGPAPSVTSAQEVTVDYKVGSRRVDSVIRLPDGSLTLREGISGLTDPQPSALAAGETRIGNYFLDYFNRPDQAAYFPCAETSDQAVTCTVSRSLDRVLAKLKNGEPVSIVCWGDSVTTGAEASSRPTSYPQLFVEGLRKLYPHAQITLTVVAVGGSQSREWLYPDKFPHPATPQACRFEKVLAPKPDLVTVEFLNDAWMTSDILDQVYSDILQRLQSAGTEIVLIRPNFTMPEMMKSDNLKTKDQRPFIAALASFAAAHHLALADASSRWAHLWKEGIPYVTLLHNGINHPDDRGHALYAEELLKCFSPGH